MITVVIPHYNQPDTLRRALGNTAEAAAWVVVDDGSRDEDRECAFEIAHAAGARFEALPANVGPGAARNAGAALAETPWIAFLDADDVLLPGYRASMEAFVKFNPDVDAVRPGVEIVGLDEATAAKLDPIRRRKAETVMPSGLLVRAEIFRRLGGFPTDPVFRGDAAGEDVALINALAATCNFARFERVLVRAHAGKHLVRYLNRSRVTPEGKVVFEQATPEEASGELVAAMKRYIDAAKANLRPTS